MPFKCTKTYFVCRIIHKISDMLWAMLGNDWKRVFYYVLWFVSIVLNFNDLCDAYTVQRHYTIFLQS